MEVQDQKAIAEQERLALENAHLRAQINPHFLFNTLGYFHNKVLDIDLELADGLIALSDIMRSAIRTPDEQGMVPLQDELSSIESLVNIYRLRYNDSVAIGFKNDVDEHANLKILPHILITLVENAMKHGNLHDPVHPLSISISIDKETMHFKVGNKKQNGLKELSHGIGLKYIRSQLEYTYKDNSNLEIRDTEDHYTVVLTIALSSMRPINTTAIERNEQTKVLHYR